MIRLAWTVARALDGAGKGKSGRRVRLGGGFGLAALALSAAAVPAAHADGVSTVQAFFRYVYPTKSAGVTDITNPSQSGGVTTYSWVLYLNPNITYNSVLTDIFASYDTTTEGCPGCGVSIRINGTLMNPDNTGALAGPSWPYNPTGKLGGWYSRSVYDLCNMIQGLPDGPWYCNVTQNGSLGIYKAGRVPPQVVVSGPNGYGANPSLMFPGTVTGYGYNPVQMISRYYPSSGTATTNDGSNTGSTTGGTKTSGGSTSGTTTSGGG